MKNIILLFWFIFHPVHVTLTSVDYVPENDCLKVFVKLYFDDFLLDIEQSESDFLDDKVKSKEITEGYINRKLIIKADNKTLIGRIEELEVVDIEVKMHIEYKTSGKPEELIIENLIMTELYADQANLMIIKVEEFEEGFKFTPDITKQVFKIAKE